MDEKEFILNDRNLILDWSEIQKELDKCILVCANYHREIHAGLHPELEGGVLMESQTKTLYLMCGLP